MVGLSPKVDISTLNNISMYYYNIKPDKANVNKYIESLRKRYGSMISPKNVEDGDMLNGLFIELLCSSICLCSSVCI